MNLTSCPGSAALLPDGLPAAQLQRADLPGPAACCLIAVVAAQLKPLAQQVRQRTWQRGCGQEREARRAVGGGATAHSGVPAAAADLGPKATRNLPCPCPALATTAHQLPTCVAQHNVEGEGEGVHVLGKHGLAAHKGHRLRQRVV